MDIFADKTVFIIGAASDLTWRLLPILTRAEARVILMDDDADELLAMARKEPALIEPLTVEKLNAATCRSVGEIWGDEPIDILLDLLALGERGDPAQSSATSKAALTAFEPALMSADGCVVSVIPKSQADDDLATQMAEAAHLKMASALSKKWARWRVTHNVLRPERGAPSSSMVKAVQVAVQAGWDNFTGVHIPIASAAH